MFLSLKFIHSVLSSAPAPEGHYLPISELSVHLFPGSLICHELSHVLFDGVLGPHSASHLPTHSKCKRTHFWRAAICTGVSLLTDLIRIRVHNHLAVLCYLNNSQFHPFFVVVAAFFFFFFKDYFKFLEQCLGLTGIQWIIDLLLLIDMQVKEKFFGKIVWWILSYQSR